MREIKIGQKYRHFKGGEYLVLDIVTDADSNNDADFKKLVIYQNLHDKLKWARALTEFASLTDKEKYPEITQKYRFEEIN